MVIVRTPYRISLAGGGSDFPSYFNTYTGAVIGFAITQYCHISLRELPPYFEYKTRVTWSKLEHALRNEDIEHPAVRVLLAARDKGFSVHHDGDLPAKSGMGSSSAFVVGLVHALAAFDGEEHVNKSTLAMTAINIERGLMHEPGGWQDQLFAAHGGFSRIDFQDNGFSIHPIYISRKRLGHVLDHLMMVFTSFQRNAFELEHVKTVNLEQNLAALKELHDYVNTVEQILTVDANADMKELGKVLTETWKIKKTLAKNVSDPSLDSIFQTALDSGAYGGKLLGAGGGGYFLFVVPPDRRESVKQALDGLIEVPVNIDFYGSRVMKFDPYGR